MTLQQLKYIIKVAETGSIHTAAIELFITQPSLSKAIMELEKEMNIVILNRTNRGVTLTEDGIKFLSYAKQVVEQADLLECQYKRNTPAKRIFAVSSQHYTFVINSFAKLIQQIGKDEYEFSLRELKTHEVIEDVVNRRSEIGFLYLSEFNKEIMQRNFHSNDLKFVELFKVSPNVIISNTHPLKSKKKIKLSDLLSYPRITYDQGVNYSFFYSEEMHSIEHSPKNIIVTDRATLYKLINELNGYTVSSGMLSSELNGNNIISIPLESDDTMTIGYIQKKDQSMSLICQQYLQILKDYISTL